MNIRLPRYALWLMTLVPVVTIGAVIYAMSQDPDRWPERKLDVWYVPTTHEVVNRMLDMADIGPLDVVYDLGCGDGRIVIAAAKQYGTRGVGIDLDPARIREARANAKLYGDRKSVV